MKHSGKIFCIGMTKTGTSSLHQALLNLGYKSIHHPQDIHASIQRALAEGLPPLAHLAAFDAVTSSNWVWQNYKSLDEIYPASKFVLTMREEKAWLASLERHALLNTKKKNYTGKFLKVNARQQLQRRAEHLEDVKAYFKSRPEQLLIMWIAEGDGYEKLAPFLGCPVPADSFPRLNSTRQRVARFQKDLAALDFQQYSEPA